VFQFLPSTWASLGLTGDPAAATWRQQLDAAVRLRARDGLGAWDCARILGYT
jgi:resuscitation-promoting factor RpfB